MDVKTQRAVYKWFEKRNFVCSFEEFADKFEFADPSITFSGFIGQQCADDWTFKKLNFHELIKPSWNHPSITPKLGRYVWIKVDGVRSERIRIVY